MRVIINKARGIGISLLMSLKILLLAMFVKGEYIIVSQDKDGANHILKYIQDFYEQLVKMPIEWKTTMKGEGAKNEKLFSNGSIIKSVSSKPQAIRGYHGFVFWDECAYHFQDVALMKAINGCLRPNFPLYMSSTPNEESGEFYRKWKEAVGTDAGGRWKKIELPYTINTLKAYVDSVEEERKECEQLGLMDMFDTEYKCKFVNAESKLFSHSLLSQHVDLDEEDVRVDIETVGIDFGKRIAHSELVGVGKDKAGVLRIPTIVSYPLKEDYEVQLSAMVDYLKTIKTLMAIYPDKTGVGIPLCEKLEKTDIGYLVRGTTYNNTLKEKMIMFLYTLVCSGKILLPNNKKLIGQLESLKRTVTDSGHIKYKHEEGAKDDVVWALSTALIYYHQGAEGNSESTMPECVNHKKYAGLSERISRIKRETRGML